MIKLRKVLFALSLQKGRSFYCQACLALLERPVTAMWPQPINPQQSCPNWHCGGHTASVNQKMLKLKALTWENSVWHVLVFPSQLLSHVLGSTAKSPDGYLAVTNLPEAHPVAAGLGLRVR